MKISVIIPMYNEESIVEGAVATLDAGLTEHFGVGEYEMIFVSDGSRDKCMQLALALTDKYPSLRVLGYENNRGKGCAVRTGMLEARGDFALFTDCDLAYGVDIISDFYKEFEKSNSDIIIGSRAMKGGGYDGYTFVRKVMSKMYLKFVSVMAGFDLSDSQCGIKGFSNKAAHDIFSLCEADGFEFDLEAIMIGERMGLRISEYPVRIINHRQSKINPVKDSLKMIKQVQKIKKRVKEINKNRAV